VAITMAFRKEGMFQSESEFVRWLQTRSRGAGRVRLGIGDDAALAEVKRGQELILTTDLSIEDVHFKRHLHSAHAVGHRALARSLSDIAAMGGTPRYALVSLALSQRLTRAWVEEFYRGMLALARRFGTALIGGDTAIVSGATTIDVIVAGEVPRREVLRRSGARPGDQIYVSGRLGFSALGLRLLKSRTRIRGAEQKQALQAHLYPEPQCSLGRFLSERRLASALMDVSDGLSTDLARLCEASGVGARLHAASLPGPAIEDAAEGLELALHGGEDYQLLFAVPPSKAPHLPRQFRGVPLHWIGEILRSRKLQLVGINGKAQPLELRGWDHFRRST
jgi:thiamine-monophosphate kinase